MLLAYTDSFVQSVLKVFRETIDPWSKCAIWHGSESVSAFSFPPGSSGRFLRSHSGHILDILTLPLITVTFHSLKRLKLTQVVVLACLDQ
jgi:hypothetical protein